MKAARLAVRVGIGGMPSALMLTAKRTVYPANPLVGKPYPATFKDRLKSGNFDKAKPGNQLKRAASNERGYEMGQGPASLPPREERKDARECFSREYLQSIKIGPKHVDRVRRFHDPDDECVWCKGCHNHLRDHLTKLDRERIGGDFFCQP
jgi:hypothetical protein